MYIGSSPKLIVDNYVSRCVVSLYLLNCFYVVVSFFLFSFYNIVSWPHSTDYNTPESFRLFSNIVSLIAANTNLIFEVSVA